MARTKEQNERMIMATRKKILDAGLKLFAQKGFAITAIKDIAQAAGISAGLIYRHFASKEELYCKLIGETVKELEKAIHRLDAYESPVQAFIDMTAGFLIDIQSSENLSCYFLLICRSALEEEALPQMAQMAAFRQTDLALYDKAAALIKKGQQMGAFKPGDPYKLALLYFSVIQGMANMILFMKEKYIAPEIEDVMAFLLK